MQANFMIMITGARGYIGTALAKRLSAEGHLNDIDAVIHLSWRTDLHAAEANPQEDYELNVKPVLALIKRATPVIFASTVTIVGPAPPLPVNDATADQPCSVYDRHKLECENMLFEATDACSLRLSNVYGYSGVTSINSNRGILNAAICQALQGGPLTLYGNGAYLRDFIFISDVVDAFCRALAYKEILNGGHYVITSGRGHTLAEAFEVIAQETLAYTGRPVEIRHVPEPPDLHPIERRNFVGDSTRFQKLTGWRPQVDLRSGIRDYFRRSV